MTRTCFFKREEFRTQKMVCLLLGCLFFVGLVGQVFPAYCFSFALFGRKSEYSICAYPEGGSEKFQVQNFQNFFRTFLFLSLGMLT